MRMPKIRMPVATIRTVKDCILTDWSINEGGLFLFWSSLIEDFSRLPLCPTYISFSNYQSTLFHISTRDFPGPSHIYPTKWVVVQHGLVRSPWERQSGSNLPNFYPFISPSISTIFTQIPQKRKRKRMGVWARSVQYHRKCEVFRGSNLPYPVLVLAAIRWSEVRIPSWILLTYTRCRSPWR